jgi:hypothetical protein
MTYNTIIHPSVGADLSRTPPIHRLSWMFRYSDEDVKKHFRTYEN